MYIFVPVSLHSQNGCEIFSTPFGAHIAPSPLLSLMAAPMHKQCFDVERQCSACYRLLVIAGKVWVLGVVEVRPLTISERRSRQDTSFTPLLPSTPQPANSTTSQQRRRTFSDKVSLHFRLGMGVFRRGGGRGPPPIAQEIFALFMCW